MEEHVQIFDTTLRDGEQVPGCHLNAEEKVIIAKALEKMGVDIIEAGFPVSSKGDFNAVKEIAKNVSNSTVTALSRAVEKDIDAAAEAIKDAKKGRIHTGIATSDIHIETKLNSTRDKVLERAFNAVKYAKKYVEDVQFYAEDAGRTEQAYLAQVIEEVIKAGATVVNIPDTTGFCLPEEYGKKIRYLKENVKGIDKVVISTHCHNDLGMASANSIAAVQNGARQIECTINGIGERAGNTSLEEVVMIIKKHEELPYYTRIDTTQIYPISTMVSEMMHMPVQPNKAIVGRNAFSHSSGIHQDGVIKNRMNYEIIDPHEVGVDKSSIILTARSGRAALNHNLKQIGVNIKKEEMEDVYQRFLELAEKVKVVTDDELKKLMEEFSHKTA